MSETPITVTRTAGTVSMYRFDVSEQPGAEIFGLLSVDDATNLSTFEIGSTAGRILISVKTAENIKMVGELFQAAARTLDEIICTIPDGDAVGQLGPAPKDVEE